MIKYRLKKDYHFPNGNIAKPQELIIKDSDSFYIVTETSLGRDEWFSSDFVESNTEFFEKVTPELWKPEMGECYWAAIPYGFSNIIHEYQWEDCDFDNILLERGFIFPTEEQAKAHSEYLIECGLKKRMEDLEG